MESHPRFCAALPFGAPAEVCLRPHLLPSFTHQRPLKTRAEKSEGVEADRKEAFCIAHSVMEEARMPRFFKVLVGDFARRIEIPQAFLCHIPEESRRISENTMAASAQLKNAEGKAWPVALEETNGRVFLTTGWPKFVEDNCLREGEFLVVKSEANLHFMVLVFGVNAVERSVWSSRGATCNLDGKLPCDIFPSRRGNSGDQSTEMPASITHGHSQTVTLQSTQRDDHISSHDELGTCFSCKWPMEDDKAKAIAKVMRTFDMDRLTVELFCATLGLYKWNVDTAAEEFDVCKGKQQISPELSLKKKLILQFSFVKEQLQHFFPLDDNSCAPMHERWKNKLDMLNLSNQSLPCDLTPAKRKLVDKHESCDLSHQQKRGVGKLQRGSPHTDTPRRSLRLARLKNTSDWTNNTLKERSEILEPSLTRENQVKDRADKSCLLYEKHDCVLKGVHEEVIGSLSQDFRKFQPMHNQIESGEKQTERSALLTSETFMSTGSTETWSLPTNSKLTSDSRITELSVTWKSSQQGNPLENILLDIERDNFMNTIAHIQKIIRDELPDLQTADIIENIVRTGIPKWDLCLRDSNAQKIVNVVLEHAKKVKERNKFNIDVRKEEFSVKLQDRSKWQLKEMETGYTSLELDYKKATADASICFLKLEEHRKTLCAIEDGIKDLQQDMMTKEDELQKLRHQVSEHETMYQKLIMEKVKVKMALKSYHKTLDEVKRSLSSDEPSSIDVEALVKVEMDNACKEIELSKGIIISINIMKE